MPQLPAIRILLQGEKSSYLLWFSGQYYLQKQIDIRKLRVIACKSQE